MEHQVQNSRQLLKLSENQELYYSLVLQLEKDFTLANNPLNITSDIKSEELIKVLVEKIYFLMMEKFSEYLNVLYVIDIPEKEFQHIEVTDAVEVSGQVAFLILNREFQKVWLRNKYK
ncbi:hypothetical protein [Maribacter cobaltidurans]|uniref:Uncharacterized protein n=1 Tax=Maribacter cobaltidurans TaxID=1178778 RepID=A0A223V2R7_9FLAO|nr:hypothetical protein [Maribacter cobaltidurans]ASV29537.1 hypothetical protein CJ263_04495 [Maribacter cobaltidurans]GGD68180.1 hypothetical protein GCM10011412_02180 [Maribacter cobaltidurans]